MIGCGITLILIAGRGISQKQLTLHRLEEDYDYVVLCSSQGVQCR